MPPSPNAQHEQCLGCIHVLTRLPFWKIKVPAECFNMWFLLAARRLAGRSVMAAVARLAGSGVMRCGSSCASSRLIVAVCLHEAGWRGLDGFGGGCRTDSCHHGLSHIQAGVIGLILFPAVLQLHHTTAGLLTILVLWVTAELVRTPRLSTICPMQKGRQQNRPSTTA